MSLSPSPSLRRIYKARSGSSSISSHSFDVDGEWRELREYEREGFLKAEDDDDDDDESHDRENSHRYHDSIEEEEINSPRQRIDASGYSDSIRDLVYRRSARMMAGHRNPLRHPLVFVLLLLAPAFAIAQTVMPSLAAPLTGIVGNSSVAGNGSQAGGDGKYVIEAEGIRACFVPYGASISNLFVADKNGSQRDIVLGFDNATYYTLDGQHPHLGAVPGRYANRIKNSTFELDGTTYHTSANENGGLDTLHGGADGWDWRNWTVVAHTTDSITFSLADQDGNQGFPGEVVSYVTYTLTPYQWHIRMVALPLTKTTPIMLSSHTYWNLDAFADPSTPTALNHTLHLPFSGQRIDTDNILIPTGSILSNNKYSVNDFYTSPKQVGANFSSPDALGNCGFNCTGYDTCYLINRPAEVAADWRNSGPVATLASEWSGIQVDVYTDQEAFQVYSCGGQNGTLTLKETQGLDGRERTVPQYGCVVMEVEDWIDGINHPEWGRTDKQVFGPGGKPYVLEARYDFSIVGNQGARDFGYGGMKKGRI